jgi:hypothetical protein
MYNNDGINNEVEFGEGGPNNDVMSAMGGMNQMDFVDPHYINEQQQAFNIFNSNNNNGKTKTKKKRENNFVNEMEQQQQQYPPNVMNSEENNLDMIVGGGIGGGPMDAMDGDDIYGDQNMPKTKKKKRNNPIEVIDDLNTPELPVAVDPQEQM